MIKAGVQCAIELLRSGELADRYAGLITVERHPTAPLAILNYTDECQYRHAWDEVTTQCRGLVVDTQRWLPAALPFPKFFNLEEQPEALAGSAAEPFSVFEKLDGSLGILYPTPEGPALASRGSFVSREARLGTKALRKLSGLEASDRLPTLLFEMMLGDGPQLASNHVRGLVLLGAFDRASGRELEWGEVVQWADRLGCHVPKVYPFESLDAVLARRKTLPASEEGYVLRFRSGLRVKVKGEAYLRALRANREGLAEDRIVEAIRHGTLEDLRRTVPEELLGLFDPLADRCARELAVVGRDLDEARAQAPNDGEGKAYALWVKAHVPAYLQGPMFSLRAGRRVDWHKTMLAWRSGRSGSGAG